MTPNLLLFVQPAASREMGSPAAGDEPSRMLLWEYNCPFPPEHYLLQCFYNREGCTEGFKAYAWFGRKTMWVEILPLCATSLDTCDYFE